MTYYRNFQVVANEYAATKPVNEREHDRNDLTRKEFGTSRDLRPIANRYRKWERIAKISDTCYALLCGHTYGDRAYMAWRYKNADPVKPDIIASYAPIAWHRIGDKDVISVSNAHYDTATSHINFLKTWLPRGMTFVNQNGKHFLRVQHAWGETKDYSLRKADPDEKQTKYNSYNLKFEVVGDGVFAPYKLPDVANKKQMKRVDITLKRRFKVRLEEFNQWVMAMGPLFPKDWKSRDEAQKQAQEYINKVPSYHQHRIWNVSAIPPEIAREVLIHHDHPLRMYIGMEAWRAVAGGWGLNPERASDRLRSFNNKVFGFEKEVDVEL